VKLLASELGAPLYILDLSQVGDNYGDSDLEDNFTRLPQSAVILIKVSGIKVQSVSVVL
jgi:hypothetical protein